MSSKLFALLVGIDEYPASVGPLRGCVRDVQRFNEYLQEIIPANRASIEILLNADATRNNIIDQFKNHLAKAGKDDLVVFQFCGHGARWRSAKQFNQFFPDGMDEGLVCIDSREPDMFDLADKELAVLLANVAEKDPHIATIFDCCHSGSMTRSADHVVHRRSRRTHERKDERPLETYLNGYYSEIANQGKSLKIPYCRSVSLSACQRFQEAWEATNEIGGVFSCTLLDVLHEKRQAGTEVSYADLLVRCREVVRRRADNQDPQFETYGGFNAYQGFLGGAESRIPRRFSIYFSDDGWQVECGAIHGLPSEPHRITDFAVYSDSNDEELVGHAATVQVGAQKSLLDLGRLSHDQSQRYKGEITSMPVAPLPVFIHGDTVGIEKFQTFFNSYPKKDLVGVSWVNDVPESASYEVLAENGSYFLKIRESQRLIQGATGYTRKAMEHICSILTKISTWERALGLQNHATQMNPAEAEFKFCEVTSESADGDVLREYGTGEITIEIEKVGDRWQKVRSQFRGRNHSHQQLHFTLAHLGDDFSIEPFYNEPVPANSDEFTISLKGKPKFNLGLREEDGDLAIHNFMLIVSTEKVDDFLLNQTKVDMGHIERSTRSGLRSISFGDEDEDEDEPREKYKNDWFTKIIRIKLVRQLGIVSEQDATLAGGAIRVRGHRSVKANIALEAAKPATRGLSGTSGMQSTSELHRALETHSELELVKFSRGADGLDNALELSGIQNAESLVDDPLLIELDIDLKEGEFVLPVSTDGEHLFIAGDSTINDSGKSVVSIQDVPVAPANRRSIGKALKLYFFKTFLQRDNVNRLCWVDFKEDGTVERKRSGVKPKVANAANKNVLLILHGIIGDTKSIVEGITTVNAANGEPVHRQFDVVLTYDYENLNTSIEDTARQLKQQLNDEAGINADDDIRLTLLVHSMGGLVSRWFIEREGGGKMVDHLVMFGTPNVGSPFGNVDVARKMFSALTTLAMGHFPGFVPFGSTALFLLNRSKNLTKTLEQMNPDSKFITDLNNSDDPKVPYTIVAGDIRDYEEPSDDLFPRLLEKIGRGVAFDWLYDDAGHDLAVSNASTHGIPENRNPPAKKATITCHHLNYFVARTGLDVIAGIDWNGETPGNV